MNIGDCVIMKRQAIATGITRGWQTGTVVEIGEKSRTVVLEHADGSRSVVWAADILGIMR